MNTTAQILPLPTLDVGQQAERRLRESPYFFLRNLNCQFTAGVLTVRGRVPLIQLKQFAETIVARVEGVEEIVNRIEVCDPTRYRANAPEVRNAG